MSNDWRPQRERCEWPRDAGLEICGNEATSVVVQGQTLFRNVCDFHRGLAQRANWLVYDPRRAT